ncbi:mitogen-activated protein kinase kinase kinase 20-like [Argentina anserina]|uniref:mitogen-activated protein kinase kinase kinase 20-like n=1 Tax=Argentina anserina TaxID=57926 RepID=UPI002176954A|nr:mitogen-activated protein kinase kinase kinase 20-like [Potentilla anserina]
MDKLEKKRKRIHIEEPDSGVAGRTKRWVRQRFLGAGQFGRVFLACPVKPGSKMPPVMAVKSARVSDCADLVKESRLLKKFKNCPFVIDTYGSDVTKDVAGEELFNLFLELAQRGTVEDWIQRLKNFGLHEMHVRRYTESLLKGLKYIHGKGFVHCDIKPANVLLVRQGPLDTGFGSYVAKIGDLGLTKKADKYSVMNRSDYICGTELYMSPEVSLHGIQEPPADIWALGCTVLQMLTGVEFWDVTELRDGSGVPIEIPDIPDTLSNEAKDFMGKCFILDPLERYTADMLLKHPFVCNSLPIRIVSSRGLLVPRSRVCQEPTAIPLVAGAV